MKYSKRKYRVYSIKYRVKKEKKKCKEKKGREENTMKGV